MKSRKLRIVTPDRIHLTAIVDEAESQAHAVAILAHGIMVEKNEDGFYTDLSKELTAVGITTIRFDFRGHGESEGRSEEMTIAGEITDLATVVEFAQKQYEIPVGIVATSFGASIALLYNAYEKRLVKANVLLSPVLDYSKTFLNPQSPWGKKEFGPKRIESVKRRGFISVDGFRLGIKLFTEFAFYRPGETLTELRTPTLVVHGTDDSMVPFGPSKKYGRRAKNASFLALRGADHGFEGHESRVYQETKDWLTRHLID